MKSNNELRASLHMVIARLDSGDMLSVAEWESIRGALATSLRYATKQRDGIAHEADEICRRIKP
jgi:hypothetical protein